jgi:hypothetical protein
MARATCSSVGTEDIAGASSTVASGCPQAAGFSAASSWTRARDRQAATRHAGLQ